LFFNLPWIDDIGRKVYCLPEISGQPLSRDFIERPACHQPISFTSTLTLDQNWNRLTGGLRGFEMRFDQQLSAAILHVLPKLFQ
jgi:hypothetical protein